MKKGFSPRGVGGLSVQGVGVRVEGGPERQQRMFTKKQLAFMKARGLVEGATLAQAEAFLEGMKAEDRALFDALDGSGEGQGTGAAGAAGGSGDDAGEVAVGEPAAGQRGVQGGVGWGVRIRLRGVVWISLGWRRRHRRER